MSFCASVTWTYFRLVPKKNFSLHFVNKRYVSTKNHYSNKFSEQSGNSLYNKIEASGPISIARYMKCVLTNPSYGYYTSKDVFGAKGDFITSPEVSQLFGEMIGVWIVNEWKKIHKGDIQLIELGPGRGTLMRDILRVLQNFNLTHQVNVHLVEISPVLREIQLKKLCSQDSSPKGKLIEKSQIFWHDSIFSIPNGFSVFVANEFFDALPIHKFQKVGNEWFEVLIDIDPYSLNENRLRYVLGKTLECNLFIKKTEKRQHLEVSPESLNIIKYMSFFLQKNGGFSLIIDYGHMGDKTDTFRSFRQHNQCNPLLNPGSSDLTADVDFSMFKEIVEENNRLLFFGPTTQHKFLVQLGIDMRLKILCKNANEEEKKMLKSGHEKLIGLDEMGSCFKVASMFPYTLKEFFDKYPLPGFEIQ